MPDSAIHQDETYVFDDIEDNVIEEFTTEFHEVHDAIESILLKLENQPDNLELLNDIFRQVHTVKGNLQIIGLDPISEFVHSLESVLDKVRKGGMSFNRLLSDVILLSIDLTREMCDIAFSREPLTFATARAVQSELQHIALAPQEKMSHHAKHIIKLLDPGICETVNADHKEDLEFFNHLAVSMEGRSPYWDGRTERILQVARDINEQAGYAVDPDQLDAAVYLHDSGMAFISLEILHKSGSLSEDDFNRIKSHPFVGAELLDRISGWEMAQQIILQHHEREDGNGYPKGLPGLKICDGAKILAIADTFEAMTQQRADREHKRPLLRAISEINNCAGTQFSPKWVNVFNDVIRNKRVKRGS